MSHVIGSILDVTCLATRAKSSLRIDSHLGTGGMSKVFAVSRDDGSVAAAKILDHKLAEDPRVRARFFREKTLADRVDHPARVPIHLAGTTAAGEPILVMELVVGESVEHVRRRLGGRLPVAPSLRVVSEVLEMLVACHAAGVLHRDIKTTNILFGATETSGRQVRVVDFGIAHCADLEDSSADMTLGTPSFMAPEQAAGLSADVDQRADVFSVGAVLFTLLTGKRLNRGRTHDESLFLAATQAAPKLLATDDTLPEELAEVVDRALAFDRDARFPTAAAMLEALASLRDRHEGRLTLLGIPPDGDEPAPALSSGSVPVRAPDATGTFDATPLPNLLTHILSRGLDGTLVVSSGDQREFVEFCRGAPVRRGTHVDADPIVGGLYRITRMPTNATYRFYIEDRDTTAHRVEPLQAILTTTRRLRSEPAFAKKMTDTLLRLGVRPLRLHARATPERFGLSDLERRVLDSAREHRFSYVELLDAEIAPRDVIDPLLYALGITRHLDVGVATASPAGI